MTNKGRIEALKVLTALGKKKGYLTYEEINTSLPEDITSAEQIDRILGLLEEKNIEVIDAPRVAGGPGAKKKVAESPSGGPEVEVDLSPAPVSRTDDPVRMYLREMGKTPLLSREGEIGIAKRIEDGRRDVTEAVCRAGIAVREVTFLGERLLQGRRPFGESPRRAERWHQSIPPPPGPPSPPGLPGMPDGDRTGAPPSYRRRFRGSSYTSVVDLPAPGLRIP